MEVSGRPRNNVVYWYKHSSVGDQNAVLNALRSLREQGKALITAADIEWLTGLSRDRVMFALLTLRAFGQIISRRQGSKQGRTGTYRIEGEEQEPVEVTRYTLPTTWEEIIDKEPGTAKPSVSRRVHRRVVSDRHAKTTPTQPK